MKQFQKTKFISLALVALLAFSSCESSKAGDKSDQNNYLLANLLNQNGGNAEARIFCQEAVYYMNECIGASSGFNPAVMCSDSNINQGTPADPAATPPVTATTGADNYKALVSCVKTQIAATNCNFPQNRVAYTTTAKTNFFSSCDVPSGIIITVY
ncbi:MAG: hypothetical protein IPL26_14735 [Leptospiraceae bacterium]|nr:hypothetical protein [Leptospiraceae bacterium]